MSRCTALRRPPESATGPAPTPDGRDEGLPGHGQVRRRLRVCCHTRQQAESVRDKLTGWLAERGLALNEDKTRIVHLTQGFDFLGWNFRRYPGQQAADQAVQGGRQEAPANGSRTRRAGCAARTRGRSSPRSTPSSGDGRPTTGAWCPARVFGSLGHYTWQLTYKWARWTPPEERRPLGHQQVLRKVLPVQERQVGLRQPGHRRLPAQALLDEHPAARHGQEPGIPR